jgi:hypothetical protein
MNNLTQFIRAFLFVALLALAGCASRGDVVSHGFAFDFISDSPDAELLDYRYGQSKNPAARHNPYGYANARVGQQSSTSGEMLRGDELYVKWRLKQTGEVFEKTVDLKSRLPENIEGSRVYFMVRGPQLYVYLITAEKRPKDEPPNGPARTHYLKTITLYPDSAK